MNVALAVAPAQTETSNKITPDRIYFAYQSGAKSCFNYCNDGNAQHYTNPYEYESDEWFAWSNGWNYYNQFNNLCVANMKFRKHG